MKIVLEPNQKIFFSSDLHGYHKNLCRGVSSWDLERAKDSVRDFDTIDQMNDCLINNINSVVGENDLYFFLGDWTFGGFDKIELFRNRIVCKNIHLLFGNHDSHIKNNREGIQRLFSSIQKTLDLEVVRNIRTLSYNGQMEKQSINFVLLHYAICSWENMNKGWIHLFGHSHLSVKDKVRQGKAMDVGVDGNNFKPYELKDILAIMNKQPIRAISLPSDHHEKEIV